VYFCVLFIFWCWSNEMSFLSCALTRLKLVIVVGFGGWWPREWWKTWTWGVSKGIFLVPQSVCVWVFVFKLNVIFLVSWESTFDIESSEGILVYWHAPSSLRDSNVNPKQKITEEQGVGHVPWLIALWKGRGACWNFGMGLGRVDKFHLLTQACTKPTQGG
jgi:hypothetical protein